MTIPEPRVTEWGFWATMAQHASDAWPLAMAKIAEATDQDVETVRAFLDSRHGRHFGDSVRDQLYAGKALDAAIDQWMGCTIGRQTSRDTGIPRGLPYLTGFVINEGLLAEDEVA